ncbi:LysR family transcriptional regulator [Microbacterium horticulturae]|uniref:LysR family transcriptional regulator n=1 Tax=Microbacterium horticulturae TaxID=3028316 RepID=A0ABY8BWZ9_9MICO|nr:LysR family transcriptional regulator [Microbacterium sp. KACC 23027]WEG08412.1 LysR family transcriptional regulator [Microbacterium sp. KACC 23027]
MADDALLSRLDLNLLVSLDALLIERSVTRAAERLHLSQPALSASLARLRAHFGDPILARRGNTYELTPFALRLIDHTATALEAARRVFESQATWEPAESTREFSIYGSDYGFTTLGRVVSELAAERAPGVRFRFMLHNPVVVEDAANRLRSVDGMVIPHGFLSDLSYADLWRDDWVAIVARDNAEVGDELSLAELAQMPWVMNYQTRSAFTSAERQVQQLGIEPHVEVVVESFLAMPYFIQGTKRVGIIQAALAPHAVRTEDVRVVGLPFEPTSLMNALWWHPAHSRDPEHTWMRDLFVEAGRIVASSLPGATG